MLGKKWRPAANRAFTLKEWNSFPGAAGGSGDAGRPQIFLSKNRRN